MNAINIVQQNGFVGIKDSAKLFGTKTHQSNSKLFHSYKFVSTHCFKPLVCCVLFV